MLRPAGDCPGPLLWEIWRPVSGILSVPVAGRAGGVLPGCAGAVTERLPGRPRPPSPRWQTLPGKSQRGGDGGVTPGTRTHGLMEARRLWWGAPVSREHLSLCLGQRGTHLEAQRSPSLGSHTGHSHPCWPLRVSLHPLQGPHLPQGQGLPWFDSGPPLTLPALTRLF